MLDAKLRDHQTSGSDEDFWLYKDHLVIPRVIFRRSSSLGDFICHA